MKIQVFDPFLDSATIEGVGAENGQLEELLRKSQFVLLACPLIKETKGLIGEKELRMMRADRCEIVSQTPGARLIAVADMNEERAKRMSDKYKVDCYLDYHEMLRRDDIEVIYVMSPSGIA